MFWSKKNRIFSICFALKNYMDFVNDKVLVVRVLGFWG